MHNTAMKRILFVDDDPQALGSYRSMLESRQGEWSVDVANGGEASLRLLASGLYDAVVGKLEMPRLDGAAVLEASRRLQPGAIRLIVSAPGDVGRSSRAMHVAHQFLASPCTAPVLIGALRRAFRVQDELGDPELQAIVCGIAALPSPPRVFQVLSAAMSSPDIDLEAVVNAVRNDVTLSVKVLQLVNSSCFGLGRQLVDLRQAVAYLGLRTLKHVVLGAEVFGGAETAQLASDCDLEEEQDHAVTIARIAAEIVAPDPVLADSAFTAALLHDIGELVLAAHMPDTYRRTKDALRARRSGSPPALGDAALLDLHARVGGYLAGVWGLPDAIVQAVQHHHMPGRLPTAELHLAGIVHVADCLHHFLRTGGDEERSQVMHRMLDKAWLQQSGCADQLDSWCERTLALGAELAATGGDR